ncbi:hypothetical protein [Streptomyces sp. NPDC091294]|uniref:hypothetical protein n=1 Tax=Streptomyces sp. NPDC091294 TaxID=3365992 RepID=UPI0037F8F7D4
MFQPFRKTWARTPRARASPTTNTLAEPERVVPHRVDGTTLADGRLTAALEPLSWNVIRLR